MQDAGLFANAVGDIARARGMMQLATGTGITREGLHEAPCEQGYPSFATDVKVMHALGLQFNVCVRPVQGWVPAAACRLLGTSHNQCEETLFIQ